MKFFLLILLSSGFFHRAVACLNEYHVSRSGASSVDLFAMHTIHFVQGFDKQKLEEELHRLEQEKSTGPDLQLYNSNDRAVHLIKLGRYAEAEKLLDSLLKKHPAEYNVVVNLGTLYELKGENKKALDYLRKAVQLNKDSHGGSEWFHIRVLEYKLRNRITQQIPGDTILDFSSRKEEASETANGIAWQLQERIPFTPVPDPLMAKLLLEYGDFLAEKISIRGAYVIYGIAGEYDQPQQLPITERKKQLLPLFKKYKVAVPAYRTYFRTVSQERLQEKGGEIIMNLLEDGITLNKEEKEVSEKRKKTPLWLYITGAVLLLGGSIFAFSRKKKPAA